MKTISMLIAVSSIALGCASAQAGRNPVANLRGQVVVAGPSVRAVLVGPADIHAYSAYAGGVMYTVPAVSGGDRDCESARAGLIALRGDHTQALRIEAGQVACLATVKRGSYELLWHGNEQRVEPQAIAVVDRR
jgi:hypothetical protein